MSFLFSPVRNPRIAVRKGDTGLEVAVLQLNFKTLTPPSGAFDSDTDLKVRRFQRNHGLIVDGVAGVATSRKLILVLSNPIEQELGLPERLLEGLAENESGFVLAAYSSHPSDDGFDAGPYQDSFLPGEATQERLRHAYSIEEMALEVGTNVVTQAKRYFSFGKISARRAIELAVLSHNWPAASERLARGYLLLDGDKPAQWVITATAGRLQTPNQWVASYIAKATKYVTWSTAVQL